VTLLHCDAIGLWSSAALCYHKKYPHWFVVDTPIKQLGPTNLRPTWLVPDVNGRILAAEPKISDGRLGQIHPLHAYFILVMKQANVA